VRIIGTLALAQLRHHRSRWALLALGIALVVAVPVITAAISASVDAQTVRRTIASLDLTDRTLLVNQEGESNLRLGSPQRQDERVRAELGRLTAGPVLRELVFRQLTVSGASFFLAAVDDLPRAARVVHGRLPRSCTPTRCEVVVLAGHDSARLRNGLRQLGVVVVGDVRRTNPELISGANDPGRLPVALGGDVDAMARLQALDLFGRHYAWVAPVDAERVVALGTAGYVARSADVDAALDARVGGTTFTRPDAQLLAAQDRADTSARRLGLLGGFAAVLLLGFAVVAAIGLRRESRLLTTVLTRRGATPTQLIVVTVTEVAIVAVVGFVLGGIAGAVVAGTQADQIGRGVPDAVARALGAAAPAGALLALATVAVAVAVLLWPDAQARAVWRILDLIALGCLGAAVLAADRGNASTGSVAGDPLVVALPVLVSVVAGLVAARLWAPLARLAERALPRRSLAARMGLLGAIRRPLRPVATVAFLTAATAAVVFAGAYRATLLANNADQAAYQVPLDATVTGSDTVLVPSVAPNAFGPDGRVYGVQRSAAGVTRLAGVVDSVPVVAVDASALTHVHDWSRTTGSSLQAADLAKRLQAATPPKPTLPTGTSQLAFSVTGYDPNTTVNVWLGTPEGGEAYLPLRRVGDQLVARVPAGARTLIGLGVAESYSYATHRGHATGEGNTDQPALSGTLHFGDVTADGRPLRWSWAGWGGLHATTEATKSRLSLGYKVIGDQAVVVPNFAAASALQVPIAVDPATAADAHGGLITLALDATTTLTGHVAAVLPRLPSTSGPFILADRAAYAAAVDVREPGGNPSEFWISAPTSALDRALATARFADLTVVRRDAVQAGLDADPIGRGARDLLVVVALLALAVAAVALILLVIGERRDGAGELYAWEADGTRPATLRRMLAVRMLAVAFVGIPLGVLAGLVLARAGTTLVAVDASGTTPTPPLAVTLGSLWTPLALLVGAGAGVALGIALAAASLRERYPVAAEADLR
jgi:hypothetical protein